MNYNEGTADNGNLAVWNASAVSNFNRAYTYDSLNRLSTMTDSYTGATCGGASWTYDAWSNRLDQTATKGSCLAPQFTFNTNNQIISPTGFTYDAAGNTTHDASHSYTFDAENRITAVDSGTTATYSYDALGRRVEKIVAGVTTDYLYNLSDAVAAEQAKGFTWGPGYVYLNGALIAQYGNSTTYFVHHDHLGTTRLMTNVNGSVYDSMDYMPFGEQIAGGSGTNHKFTGKERDSESGLDNFGARYFGSSFGRFMRPDPSSVGGDIVDSESPQSWNMYSYVANNPLSATDPDGLDCIYINNDTGKFEGFNSGDCDNSTTEKANSGYYVNGTVDTISTTTGDASGVVTGYSGTNNDSGTPTLLSGTFNSSAPNSNSDALNPFAQGVFTQLNQMNILNNTLKIYGASAVIGITGGAACYYLCPEAGITTLGLEGASEGVTVTPGNAASVSRAAAQGGRKAVERALRSYQKRLAEHLAKLNEIKGDPGSVQREINNFRGLIKAAEEYLSKNP